MVNMWIKDGRPELLSTYDENDKVLKHFHNYIEDTRFIIVFILTARV